ncbi:MAG: hypothetical protein GYB65_21285, partial [Chloroflexi bacterium]|nr:hypothetical protein [Chloroflexota bacterium]
MNKRHWLLVIGGMCVGVLAASLVWGFLAPATSQADTPARPEYGVSTVLLEDYTDSGREFHIPNEYPEDGQGFYIIGMTVAIQ